MYETRLSLAEKPKEKGHDKTEQDGGCYRKVEGEIFPFDQYVSRQPSDAGNFTEKGHNRPGDNENDTQNNERTPDLKHGDQLTSQSPTCDRSPSWPAIERFLRRRPDSAFPQATREDFRDCLLSYGRNRTNDRPG